MKEKDVSPEEAMKQIQKIFKKRGTKALEIAKKEILQEKIECKEAKEALTYFMTQYWHDLARPSLLSLVCEAVGGDPELTTLIAVPMTLISGAIDIHDDIIDQSKTKDRRPTVYGKFGKDVALLAGDALLFKGLSLLNQAAERVVPAEKMATIMNIMKNMFFELGDAEAMELQLRRRTDVSPEIYLQIVRKKAADVEAHTRISAILGEGTKEEIEMLGEYGRLLGMLIILHDDWIDMIDPEETRHRVQKECLPIPILYALENHKTKSKLTPLLSKGKITEKEAETILETTHKAGGFRTLEKLMQKYAQKATLPLERLKNNKETLILLIQSVTYPLVKE